MDEDLNIQTATMASGPGAARAGMPQTPYRILAVDDSEDDLFFLRWAIKRQPQFTCAGMLTSGQDALKYFRLEPPYSDPEQFPAPHLVLLDLKMPGIDGFGVLEFLRQSMPQRPFKVFVLTSSHSPADMQRSKTLGADGFETKPSDHTGYIHLLEKLVSCLAKPTP